MLLTTTTTNEDVEYHRHDDDEDSNEAERGDIVQREEHGCRRDCNTLHHHREEHPAICHRPRSNPNR